MKKLYLWLSLLCAIGTNTFAQNVSQGNLSVTGGFGMQLQNQKQTYNGQSADISFFSNQVDAAYYFADNLAVGMRGNNQVQTVKTSSGQSKSVSNIITPYLSYNASLSDNLAVRMSLGLQSGTATTNQIML